MCLGKNTDQALDKIQHCQNDEQKRRLLKKIDTCNACSEWNRKPTGLSIKCSCRQKQEVNLKNLYYFTMSERLFL